MAKLGVPTSEYEQFPSPPLRAMFGQVQFPPLLKLADPQILGAFQDTIAKSGYTEFVEEQQLSLTISPEGFSQSPAERTFRFSTEDSAWSVLIGPASLTLEAQPTKYTNFDAFSEQFELVWSALLDIAPPSKLTRQGLRYVDHIERDLKPEEWGSLVNPEILGILGASSMNANVLHCLSEFRFHADAGALTLKHGLVKAGPDLRDGYLLDFDYFTEDLDGEFSSKEVLGRFVEFHNELHDVFRYCVTDAALEEFRKDAPN